MTHSHICHYEQYRLDFFEILCNINFFLLWVVLKLPFYKLFLCDPWQQKWKWKEILRHKLTFAPIWDSGNGEFPFSVEWMGYPQNIMGEGKRIISGRDGAHGRLPAGVTKAEDESELIDKKVPRQEAPHVYSSGAAEAWLGIAGSH